MAQTNDMRLTVSVDEAAKLLGISRNSAYAAVKAGELKAVRIGRRFLVGRGQIEKLLMEGSRREAGGMS